MQDDEKFKANSISLAQYIVNLNEDAKKRGIILIDSNILNIGVELLKTFDSKQIIEAFISRSKDSWNKIKNHDAEYFRQNTSIFFSGLPENVVENMGKLLMGNDEKGNFYIKNEYREKIWEYMEAFVKISLRYLGPDGSPYLSIEKYNSYKKLWNM